MEDTLADEIEGPDEDNQVKVGTLDKGRVTINSDLRELLKIEDGTNIAMWIENEEENVIGMRVITDDMIKEMLQ